MKRNVSPLVNLENTVKGEISHKGAHIILFCFYETLTIGKSIETESRLEGTSARAFG